MLEKTAVLALKAAARSRRDRGLLRPTQHSTGRRLGAPDPHGVRDCALFLPIVSRHAAERDEGWFLKEWGFAIERAQGMKAHMPFIQPILVDDLPDCDDRIPPYFWTRQCRRFPGGAPAPGFVAGTQSTLREIQLRKAGLQ